MRFAEIKTHVLYEEDRVVYNCIVYVTISSDYEVEAHRFSEVTTFSSETGEPIEIEMEIVIQIQIEALAAQKALGMVQSEDFAEECERE